MSDDASKTPGVLALEFKVELAVCRCDAPKRPGSSHHFACPAAHVRMVLAAIDALSSTDVETP